MHPQTLTSSDTTRIPHTAIGVESADFIIPFQHRRSIGRPVVVGHDALRQAPIKRRRPFYVHHPLHRDARISVVSAEWNGCGYNSLRIGRGTNTVAFLQGNNVRSGLTLREQCHLTWEYIVSDLNLLHTEEATRLLLWGEVPIIQLAIHIHVCFPDKSSLRACLAGRVPAFLFPACRSWAATIVPGGACAWRAISPAVRGRL